MNEKISIVLPACDEEGTIEEVIRQSYEYLKKKGYDGEIIVINDGSRDNTGKIVSSLREEIPNLKLLNHRKRKGLTEALVTGFSNVSGDIIIFLPADLQSKPIEDIPKLLSVIFEGYDIAAGCRKGRKEFKIFASGIYNFLCKLMFNVNVKDQNWIKAFKREVIEDIPLRANWHRYIIPIACNEGYTVKEVETNWYPRQSGNSKFGFRRLFAAFIDLIVVKFRLSFMKKPMYFFGGIGAVFFVSGFTINLLQVISDYLLRIYDIKEHIPMVILGVSLMILGFQIISLGFLGELIVEQFSTKKKRRD
ncbi:MAG: glycosyltransferase family 2 protein [Candidatus Schekmanbacteria bacterium]|nr:MAG: glycosyltransferase family 2 protein [Candidatus Schekmanbacteria bacterium]